MVGTAFSSFVCVYSIGLGVGIKAGIKVRVRVRVRVGVVQMFSRDGDGESRVHGMKGWEPQREEETNKTKGIHT